jgi:hypothetical protein
MMAFGETEKVMKLMVLSEKTRENLRGQKA